jgi:hypothetical protein
MIKVNVCWPALSRLNDAYQGRGRKQPGLTKGRGINKLRFRLVQDRRCVFVLLSRICSVMEQYDITNKRLFRS